MRLDTNQIDDLAGILHAYEDPYSDLSDRNPLTDEYYEEDLDEYVFNYYEILSDERRTGLREAVGFISGFKPRDDLYLFVPDLYRKIWNHLQDTVATEVAIRELDRRIYIAGIEAVQSRIVEYERKAHL